MSVNNIIHEGENKYNSELLIDEEQTLGLATDETAGLVKLRDYDLDDTEYASIDSSGHVRYKLPEPAEVTDVPIASSVTPGIVLAKDRTDETGEIVVDDSGKLWYEIPEIPEVDLDNLIIESERVSYEGRILTEVLDEILLSTTDRQFKYMGAIDNEDSLPDFTLEEVENGSVWIILEDITYIAIYASGTYYFIGKTADVPDDITATSVTALVGNFDNIADRDEVLGLISNFLTDSDLNELISDYVTLGYLENNYPTRDEVTSLINSGGGSGTGVLSVNGVTPDEFGDASISALDIPIIPVTEETPDFTNVKDYIDGVTSSNFNFIGVFEEHQLMGNVGDVYFLKNGDDYYKLYAHDGTQFNNVSDSPFEKIIPGDKTTQTIEGNYGAQSIGGSEGSLTCPFASYDENGSGLFSYNNVTAEYTCLVDIDSIYVEVGIRHNKGTANSYMNGVGVIINGDRVDYDIGVGGYGSIVSGSGTLYNLKAGDVFEFKLYNRWSSVKNLTTQSYLNLSVVGGAPDDVLYNTGSSLFLLRSDNFITGVPDVWENIPVEFIRHDVYNSHKGIDYGEIVGDYIILNDDVSSVGRYFSVTSGVKLDESANTTTGLRMILIHPDDIEELHLDSDEMTNAVVIGEVVINQSNYLRAGEFTSRNVSITYIDEEDGLIKTRDGYRIYLQMKSNNPVNAIVQSDIYIKDIKKR